MSMLSRLARGAARGLLGNRTQGLGTRVQRPPGGLYVEKPPIEKSFRGGLRSRLRRQGENLGLLSRLDNVGPRFLNMPEPPTPPAPPYDGPPSRPATDTLPQFLPRIEEGGGLTPPPFPAGRRSSQQSRQDEWMAEWFRRRQQELQAQDDQEDEIETLGRDYSYDEDDMALLSANAVEVQSSNVFSYFWQPESRSTGILYVTFLAPAPGKNMPRQGPGATYAYYGVTLSKFRAFKEQAASSPGAAVWDHLRVRGTIFGHQVQYRLISVTGTYIPRKATARGFKTRYLKPVGRPSQVNARLPKNATDRQRELERRGFRRSTLPPQEFARPERGNPDRGTPNRG